MENIELILSYSFVPNCRGSQIANFEEKIPETHLIIIRKWPKNNPPF